MFVAMTIHCAARLVSVTHSHMFTLQIPLLNLSKFLVQPMLNVTRYRECRHDNRHVCFRSCQSIVRYVDCICFCQW